MPEGDSLRAIARRLEALVGEVVRVETPHPRAAALGIAERLDGRRLEHVDAVGKNLLLRFEGGAVLRSHLMMRGRWQLRPAGARPSRGGVPWLVVRGRSVEAVLWHGPVLELGTAVLARLGPDVLDVPLDLAGIVRRLRRLPPETTIADALLEQSVVAGIGNRWRAEALFLARVSPWTAVARLGDDELARVVAVAHRAMREGRATANVYGRAGRPCRACGSPVAARRHGDGARTVYWCPRCQQAGTRPGGA
jgi:endonuclease-8